MKDAGTTLRRYRDLVTRYHATLDLMSERGLAELDRLIEEGQRFAALLERLVGADATVVDIGSGAGLPGVVIAACLPEATVHLVERRRRRVAFLELAVATLGLGNARVFGGDVRLMTGVAANAVTAQAVARLAELAELSAGVRADPAWLITRRGEGWREGAQALLGTVGAATRTGADPTAGDPPESGPTESGPTASATAAAEVVEEPLEHRGSLVALKLLGGAACRSSA